MDVRLVAGDLRETLVAQLAAARRRTLELLAPLSDADLVRQHSPLASPLVWDLAHIGWFEELWLPRRLLGAEPLRPELDALYDAFEHPRAGRSQLPLLSPAQARAYLAEVRVRALTALDETELDPDDTLLAGGFVFGLVLQHELQHQETMLQTIQLSGLEHPGGGPRSVKTSGSRAIEAGEFRLGADEERWAYDNERPAHEVDLPAFRIGAAPVTNAEWIEFLAARGRYEPPLSWERLGAGWARRRFGRLEPVPLDEPVQHVSYEEAEAYARFAGARLPTEAEWEQAARLGVLEGAAQVWEWTASPFRGYPGFEAFPYREYSEVFFGDDYRVLRGGSWATHPLVARITFRNWDFPTRRQIFAGLRLAWSA
jgi:iron(II)-dependent oxidoreductase